MKGLVRRKRGAGWVLAAGHLPGHLSGETSQLGRDDPWPEGF